MRFLNKYVLVVLLLTTVTACKKWDDHIAVDNQDLTQDLYQAIAANPDLSTFTQYIRQTGTDSVLQSTKTYTVWAPTNAALQTLDPAIVSDPVKLKAFVWNHISNQSYFTRDAQTSIRVPLINGKYNNFQSTKFDDANLVSKDRYVKNGVLHTIDKGIVVLPNLWDFVNSSASQYTQNGFIAGLNYNDFDPSLAVVDSISSVSGLPVYHPGTGIVVKNKFNEKIVNLKREDKQYTYFVIDNSGFQLESDSLKKYFASTSTTSTDSLAKWNEVKDLIVEGVYTPSTFGGLVSKYGVPLPVNPADITQTIKLSNGVVYVLNKLDAVTANKFKEIRIEGENPDGFSRTDKRSYIMYRVRLNPVTNQVYNDLNVISGHGVSGFYSYYRLNELPSIKYKVYALGVNDFQTTAFPQRIEPRYVGASTTITSFVHNVPLSSATGAYNEIYLGDLTLTSFGNVEFQLVAQNTPTGTNAPVAGTNPLVLDYIRLVPVP